MDAAGKLIHSDNNRSSQIMYTADGYVGVVSTPSGRKKTSAPAGRTDLVGSTPEELVEATRSVTCYAGHYELKDGEVHPSCRDGAQSEPDRRDADPPRAFRRAEPHAVGAPDAQGQVRRILWRRVPGEIVRRRGRRL